MTPPDDTSMDEVRQPDEQQELQQQHEQGSPGRASASAGGPAVAPPDNMHPARAWFEEPCMMGIGASSDAPEEEAAMKLPEKPLAVGWALGSTCMPARAPHTCLACSAAGAHTPHQIKAFIV